ncbi:MAG: hypothetical protein KY432_09360, partial [Acidobacteria bacterium]|nr:hypothetical protein [Acidobacteriota bacterium]
YSMEVTPDGSVWAGTRDGGLHRIRGGKVTSYRVADGLPSDTVNSVAADGDGSLWIGTAAGLARFDDGRIVLVDLDPLPSGAITALFVDDAQSLWIGGDGGIVRRSRDGDVAMVTGRSELYDIIRPLYLDRDQNLWIGTTRGLKRLRDGRIESAIQPELAVDSISAIYEDREGSLWIGTMGEGLNRLRDGTFTSVTTQEGLPGDHVRVVYETRDGTLWIGTTEGLSTFEGSRVTRTLTRRDGLPDDVIMALFEDSRGNLWIGTNDGGAVRLAPDGSLALYSTREGLASNRVNAFAEDAAGGIWIGTNSGLMLLRNGSLQTFTTEDGLPDNSIRALLIAHDRSLWIGTAGGVARLLGDTFEFPIGPQAVGHTFALSQQKGGAIWIGTSSSGVYRYLDGGTIHLTPNQGLYDEIVYQILDDGTHLWMSCNRGVFRVSKSEIEAFAAGRITGVNSVSYDHSDGMASSECNGGSQPAGTISQDGRIWFPTLGGVVAVHPQRLARNRVPPPVHVESVVADRTPLDMSAAVRLAPGTSNLEFHYTALSFVAPAKMKFRYRLRGFDREWIDAGTRRVAYYTNVPAGSYEFEVMGSNNDGVWSTSAASFPLQIAPHFYRTIWFYALSLIASLALIVTIFRVRLQLLHARTAVLEERTRIAQEMHDTVAQGLIAIMMEVESIRREATSAPETAALHAEAASNLVRESLNETRRSVWALNPPQLERSDLGTALARVVELANARSDVEIHLNLDGALPSLPMETELNFLRIVQEAISNALRHGMPRRISVEVRCDGGKVLASIRDDGTGFSIESTDSLPSTGFGLSGMHRRATKIGAHLVVTSAPGEGTSVVLELPHRSWRCAPLRRYLARIFRKELVHGEHLADTSSDR